jgi:hypothetical protein
MSSVPPVELAITASMDVGFATRLPAGPGDQMTARRIHTPSAEVNGKPHSRPRQVVDHHALSHDRKEGERGCSTLDAPVCTAEVTLDWTGLTAGSRYLGAVSYTDGTNDLGSTMVSITP